VVVGLLRHRARLDARREHHRSDPPAPGARNRAAGIRRVRPRLLVAAGARVGIRSGLGLRLVEGDDQQSVVPVGGRREDLRNQALEEAIRLLHAAGLAVRTGLVMSVVAQIRRDEGVVRRRRLGGEVGSQATEVHVVLLTRRQVDDRVEVHERVVASGVLVGGRRVLSGVSGADVRMATRRGLGGSRLRHVLHVAPPRVSGALQLRGDALDAGGIDAALADELPAGGGESRKEVVVELAVGLGLGVRRLSADHRDVVVEAEVPGPVVVGDQGALRGQVVGEIRDRRARAESALRVLVLEHDDEDVLVVRHGSARRTARCRQHPDGEDRGDQRPADHPALRCDAIWRARRPTVASGLAKIVDGSAGPVG
jgi:hypothetical protein